MKGQFYLQTALKLLSKINIGPIYLDLGCGNGELTVRVARAIVAKVIYGADVDENALNQAKLKEINILHVDLNRDGIPLSDSSVDLVTAFEVIEHLCPDHMIKEVYRLLKLGGYFLITTLNLDQWINRVVLLLGYQPYNVDVSTETIVDAPKRYYTRLAGHIRAYTLKAFKELLSYHGFKIVKVK